ncbi:hypothetical protein H5410_058632 [Solanum commersonii]|uniref:Uncharacterized protein n=1 Tax=Solanum commersonii TaxID=4109 RepID=A0A9J5WS44_SOLCO|nr:hypothetical protein H5410_058632 [Solanum commersonii]
MQDVLAIVINGSPSTRTTTGKLIQEFIIMDKAKKPTKLTLWEDFIDHEGVKLFNQLHDYPIILARKIGKSSSGQVFNVEAELSLASKDQRFSVLACSNCKQLFTRYNVREISAQVVTDPHILFLEKMLHLTEEIYEICFQGTYYFCSPNNRKTCFDFVFSYALYRACNS